MTTDTSKLPPVRMLPESVANKIAAGEVVERPASVVKELMENAIDARATRVLVRLVAAGRRTIEVVDNGQGMSEQDALLAIERHTTSKIRKSEDLDNITTMGFRGEALASIAAVSRLELVTRRESDEAATRLRVDGGVLRDVTQTAAPVGTRVTVNRLYFNTPVRAKFLKGVTTELSQCIDCAQRHALVETGVAFQLLHNEKALFDVPERATLRERIALIWGLNFVRDLVEIDEERLGMRLHGLIGTPELTRSQRSHQFFFLNRRPVVNRSLQYGFEDGYRGLLTVGRRPVGALLIETNPRTVDVNIHPSKREVRFRDERAVRDAVRETVRHRLAALNAENGMPQERPVAPASPDAQGVAAREPMDHVDREPSPVRQGEPESPGMPMAEGRHDEPRNVLEEHVEPIQTEFVPGPGAPEAGEDGTVRPGAMYRPVGGVDDAPMQLFDTYLLVPEDDRLLIIDQHALHERLTYDELCADLQDNEYAAQQLAVPLLVEVAPSQVSLVESNLELFSQLGLELEPFGDTTFQVTSICHLYDDSKVPDAVYRVLDALGQGDLFSREEFMADLLRLAVEACRGSVKAGDRLSPQERRELLDGFRRIRPPYTCPHGRPIITELTLSQMEKSFRRRQ
ncbi:MAG: DNA mismatch repair endonuclease MutL [bacterium]|nr:DNA mismatch repair endonuclease MutL [bacterium]